MNNAKRIALLVSVIILGATQAQAARGRAQKQANLLGSGYFAERTITFTNPRWKGWSHRATITPLPEKPGDRKVGRRRFLIKSMQIDRGDRELLLHAEESTTALVIEGNRATLIAKVRLGTEELNIAERNRAKSKVEKGVRALDKMVRRLPVKLVLGKQATIRTRAVFEGDLPVGWELSVKPGYLERGSTSQLGLDAKITAFAHEAAHVMLRAPDEYWPIRRNTYHNGKRTLMSDVDSPGIKLAPHSLEAITPVLNEIIVNSIAERPPDFMSQVEATKYYGVSKSTIGRLVDHGFLKMKQAAPYSPAEIRRADLESEPVRGILECVKRTGKLVLDPLSYSASARRDNGYFGVGI